MSSEAAISDGFLGHPLDLHFPGGHPDMRGGEETLPFTVGPRFADDLAKAIVPTVNRLLAEAWDKGFDAGNGVVTNPYRDAS